METSIQRKRRDASAKRSTTGVALRAHALGTKVPTAPNAATNLSVRSSVGGPFGSLGVCARAERRELDHGLELPLFDGDLKREDVSGGDARREASAQPAERRA